MLEVHVAKGSAAATCYCPMSLPLAANALASDPMACPLSPVGAPSFCRAFLDAPTLIASVSL